MRAVAVFTPTWTKFMWHREPRVCIWIRDETHPYFFSLRPRVRPLVEPHAGCSARSDTFATTWLWPRARTPEDVCTLDCETSYTLSAALCMRQIFLENIRSRRLTFPVTQNPDGITFVRFVTMHLIICYVVYIMWEDPLKHFFEYFTFIENVYVT